MEREKEEDEENDEKKEWGTPQGDDGVFRLSFFLSLCFSRFFSVFLSSVLSFVIFTELKEKKSEKEWKREEASRSWQCCLVSFSWDFALSSSSYISASRKPRRESWGDHLSFFPLFFRSFLLLLLLQMCSHAVHTLGNRHDRDEKRQEERVVSFSFLFSCFWQRLDCLDRCRDLSIDWFSTHTHSYL